MTFLDAILDTVVQYLCEVSVLRVFNPMTINVQRIALTHEKLHLPYCSVQAGLEMSNC